MNTRLHPPVANQTAAARPAHDSRGAAMAPPASGIDFIDRHATSHRAPPSPPTAPAVIQRVNVKPSRLRKPRYKTADYRQSSKFRFIRLRRRGLVGYATKGKVGINLFTVKYKKGGKAYYLTTRSVPTTNSSAFNLPPGHSEGRFKSIQKQFEQRHGLKPSHFVWGATEREPCGEGVGMANCRDTLSGLGIKDQQVYFSSEYADREDMRHHAHESSSYLNEQASKHRGEHGTQHAKDVTWLATDYDSEPPSEDESDVVDEYESDYGERPQKRRKRPLVKNAYWDGKV